MDLMVSLGRYKYCLVECIKMRQKYSSFNPSALMIGGLMMMLIRIKYMYRGCPIINELYPVHVDNHNYCIPP